MNNRYIVISFAGYIMTHPIATQDFPFDACNHSGESLSYDSKCLTVSGLSEGI